MSAMSRRTGPTQPAVTRLVVVMLAVGLAVTSCASTADNHLSASAQITADQQRGASAQVNADPTVTVHSDYVGYRTITDAWDAADAVAFVTYIDEKEGVLLPDFSRLVQPYSDLDQAVKYDGRTITLGKWIEESGSPVTLARAKIGKVWKGDLRPDSTITIQQGGGHIGTTLYVEEDTVMLRDLADHSVLVFLTYLPGDVYAPLNSAVGTWIVEDGTVTNASATGQQIYGALTQSGLETFASVH